MKYYYLLLFSVIALFVACNPFNNQRLHDLPYDASKVPSAPDYANENHWAALPTRVDEADGFPKGSRYPDRQTDATADVFFIYPTLYTNEPGERFAWNASVTDSKLNESIDESTIRLQASIFNAAGKVYSPRYRQAHLSAYYTQDKAKGKAAFDTAYADIKTAFEYFLKNYNNGRPIIIAAHSQGTTMGKRLVKEYFDGKPLSNQLVAAYLVGIEVMPGYFKSLQVCSSPNQTECFVSWRTWQRPATEWNPTGDVNGPDKPAGPDAIVVNPLSWSTNTDYVGYERNAGGALRKLKLIDKLSDAQIHEGILWINRPDFFGQRIIKMKRWHIADYGLFYESVRLNAVVRANTHQIPSTN